jgi:hypothetical protein
MQNVLPVYIGFDSRERVAYDVAKFSLVEKSSKPMLVTPLMIQRLQASGLSERPYRIYRNSVWDVISDAPVSTEFANTRFLVPLLAQTGWALFTDCDVVFLSDVAELFALADPRYAVMCVKHEYEPQESEKMDGCVQTSYPRKNWSSVMLFNCDHPAHQNLTLSRINNAPGRDLHRFYWLADDEIGALPGEWNWLVGVQPKPLNPKIAHFTLGGPWLPEWKASDNDELWLDCHSRYARAR